MGVVAGVLAEFVAVVMIDPGVSNPTGILENGITVAIGLYLVSFYFAKFAWYRKIGRESLNKLYTTGLLAFIGFFIVSWVLSFTLSVQ